VSPITRSAPRARRSQSAAPPSTNGKGDDTQAFLKELVEAHGAPGFEHDVAAVMRRRLKNVGAIAQDRLGSFICEKRGSAAAPKVMLAGHLDEVGFMVKSITKEGFVKFLPLGGWWGHVVLGQRLLIRTRQGDVVGVVGSKPPHELRDEDRKRVLEIKDMYIDVGAASDFDVKKKNAAGVETVEYETFTTPYAGLSQVIRGDGHYSVMQRFGLYRWHIVDPIRFEKDLRITIQALGWRSGGRYLPLQDDIASVAYWYQTPVATSQPKLPSKDALEII